MNTEPRGRALRPARDRRDPSAAIRPTGGGPLSIGFDLSPLEWPDSGIGRYTRELLAALWRSDPDLEIVPVAPRRPGRRSLPSDLDEAWVVGPRSPSRTAWTFGLMPFWLRKRRPDVFHATSYYAPVGGGVPTVLTFHDTSVFARPDCHPRSRVLRARVLLGQAARRAAAIVTPSESARQDVADTFRIDLDRIHVVPHAAARSFRPVDRAWAAAAAERNGIEPGFFLALGTVEPRKNLARTIEAIELLRADDPSVRLVVVGRPGWGYRPIVERASALAAAGAVRFVGPLSDDGLVALMGAATALVYPSLHEGFGLPVIEAMAAGLPVITSRRGATAEVGGPAALLVDPLDAPDIAAAMAATRDPGVAARLRAGGLSRAATFSWERSARETAAVYRTVSEERRRASAA